MAVYRQAVVAVGRRGGGQAADAPGVAVDRAHSQARRQGDISAIEQQMQVIGAQRGLVDGLREVDVHRIHGRGVQARRHAGQRHHRGRHRVDDGVGKGVAAGGIQVDQLDQVLQRGTGLSGLPGAVGAPHHATQAAPAVVGNRQQLAVGAQHLGQLIPGQRVGRHQVAPARLRRGRHGAAEPATGHRHLGVHRHRGLAAGAEVQRVGQVAGVGHIVDQVVGDVVVGGRAEVGGVDQLMDLHPVDQRGAQVTVVVQMGEAGREILELALQAGREIPLRGDGGGGRNIAQVNGQRVGAGLVAHLAADDLEVDQQALFVFDDLGLGRADGQVARPALADVDHLQAQREWQRGFDRVGERIVADDVALPEVVEVELGLGVDGDARRQQRHIDDAAGIVVMQRAADAVEGGRIGRGIVGGHKGVENLADGAGVDRPVAVGVDGQVLRAGAADHELAVGVVAVGVSDVQRQRGIGQRGIAVAVVQLHRALEGGAGDHRLLLDAQAHLSANATGRRAQIGAGGAGAAAGAGAAGAARGGRAADLRGVVAHRRAVR